MTCTTPGCTARPTGTGLCRSHYRAELMRRAKRQRAVFGPWCEVPGCRGPAVYGRLCQNHYQRQRMLFNPTRCRRHDCTGPVIAKGLCHSCYYRVRRGTLAVCANGCTPTKLYALGLCQACYSRERRARKGGHA